MMKFFSELNFVYTFLLLRDHGIIIQVVNNFNLFFFTGMNIVKF